MEDLSEPLEQFPQENPKGIHPDLGDGHRRVGDRGGWGLGWVARHWDSVRPVEVGMDTLPPPTPPSLPIRTGHPNVFAFYFKELDAGPERRPGPWCQLGCVGAGTLRATHL